MCAIQSSNVVCANVLKRLLYCTEHACVHGHHILYHALQLNVAYGKPPKHSQASPYTYWHIFTTVLIAGRGPVQEPA